jgi:hypothetical protein
MTAALVLLSATHVHAQVTATPLSKYGWTQTQVATAGDATALVYKEYVGAATSGNILNGETCVATPSVANSFDCTVAIPPKIVGAYSVTLTASNATSESGKSNVLTFTMQIVPANPANLHLVQLLGQTPVMLTSQRGLAPWHWKRRALLGIVR